MKTKSRFRRFLAMLLVFAMLMSQANLTVFAASNNDPSEPAVTAETPDNPGLEDADNGDQGGSGEQDISSDTSEENVDNSNAVGNEPEISQPNLTPGTGLNTLIIPKPDTETEVPETEIIGPTTTNKVPTIGDEVNRITVNYGKVVQSKTDYSRANTDDATEKDRHTIWALSLNSKAVYCTQEGTSIVAFQSDSGINWDEVVEKENQKNESSAMSEEEVFLTGLVLAKGYHGAAITSNSSNDDKREYVATQLLIWEVQNPANMTDRVAKGVVQRTFANSNGLSNWSNWHIKGTQTDSLKTKYDNLVNEINKFITDEVKAPNGGGHNVNGSEIEFTNTENQNWNLNQKTLDGSFQYTATFAGDYSGWTPSTEASGYTARVEGGQLTLSAPVNELPMSDVTITLKKTGQSVRYKITEYTDSSAQNLVTKTQENTTTITYKCYAKVKGISAATVRPEVKKTVEGPVPENSLKTFKFNLGAEAGTPMPDDGNNTVEVGGKGGTVQFGAITYKQPGDYTYTITETKDGYAGYTYDGSVWTLRVHVDYADGVLTAVPTYTKTEADGTDTTGQNAAFTNYYETKPTTWEPEVNKIVNNWEKDEYLAERQFTFTMTLNGSSDGTNFTEPRHATASKTSNWKGYFGEITFDKAGEYKFTIVEQEPSEAGYRQYDNKPHDVTVQVTDEGSQLVARVNGEKVVNSEFTFENTYADAPAEWTPSVEKVMKGNEIPDDYRQEFTFNIAQTGGPEVKIPKSSVTIGYPYTEPESFGKIEFTSQDTYTFTVSETKDTHTGYTYDENVYTVTVEVGKPNKDGQLQKNITVVSSDETKRSNGEVFEFTNTYKPTEAHWQPSVTKHFEGEDPNQEEKSFTFDLSLLEGEPDGVYIPKTEVTVNREDADWTDSFETLTFSKAGTYKFQIAERDSQYPGYKDGKAANQEVVVTVTDDHGVLKVVTDGGEGDDPVVSGYTFVNKFEYVSVDWQPQVKKVVESGEHEVPANHRPKFEFGLYSANENYEAGDLIEQVTTNYVEIKDFKTITYTEPGVHYYVVKEIISDDTLKDETYHGYTFDPTVYRVKVDVTDKKRDGALVADVTVNDRYMSMANGTNTFWFTNTYEPDPTSAVMDVTKSIDASENPGGYTFPRATEFTFDLEDLLASDGKFSMGKVIDTAKLEIPAGGTAGSVKFQPIEYKKAGTYKYLIREERGDLPGFIYDPIVWDVTVDVEDVGGKLKATVSYKHINDENADAQSVAAFKNDYNTTKTSYTPQILKFVGGAPTSHESSFNFELEKITAQSPDGKLTMGEIIDHATVALSAGEVSGFASFDEIEYDKPGTYTYRIKEVKPENADTAYKGYVFDETVWTLTVEVVDTGNALKATATYTAEGKKNDVGAEFINQYNPTGAVYAPKVKKTISGAPTSDETFTFEISSTVVSGVTMPESTTTTVTGAGEGTFGNITFTRAGTYDFTITELAGTNPRYSYDETRWTLTVNVEDHDGTLEVASHTYTADTPDVEASNDEAAFNNTYTPVRVYSVSATYAPSVRKTISGTPTEDETFTFNIRENQGDSHVKMPENTKVTVVGAGSASFGNITFTEDDYNEHTYNFTITEEAGTNLDYKYDETSWNLAVTVKRSGDTLQILQTRYTPNTPDVEARNDAAAFNNTYNPTDIPNEDIPQGDKPDEPTENIPNPDVPLASTPDTPSKTVVTTIPNPNVPLAQMPGEELEEISDLSVPLGDAPKTGDETNIGMWLAIMAVALAGVLAIPAYRRRRREDEK